MSEADKLATALLQVQLLESDLQLYGYRASETLSNAKLIQLETARARLAQEYSAHVSGLRKKYGWADTCAPNLRAEVECK